MGSDTLGTPPPKANKNQALFFMAAVFTVLAVFWRVLGADFVMWDDDILIYLNPNLKGLSLESLRWAFTDVDSTMRYVPLSLLSWSAIHEVFGLVPLGYHLANWILHGLGAGVLFIALRQMIAAYWRTRRDSPLPEMQANISALLATLLWAIHPLRVEPVAWATDLPYCLATLFLFLSLVAYLSSVNPERSEGRRRWLGVLSVALYLASLLSHPIGATYFLVLPLVDIFLLRRLGGQTGWWSPEARGVWREKALFALPALAVAALTVAIRVQSAGQWSPPPTFAEFGLLERVMQAGYVLFYYLLKPLYPSSLAPVYTALISFDPLSAGFVLRACFLTGLGALLLRFRKRFEAGAPLFFAYLILTAPAVGFFQHPHFPVDRYAHLPSVLWSVLAALTLMRFRGHRFAKGGLCLGALTLCLLAWLSAEQTRVWKNTETLFAHTIRTLGDDPYRKDFHWRLGKHRLDQGKRDLAVESFEATLEIEEGNLFANVFLAKMAREEGDLVKTKYHLEKLTTDKPDDVAIRKYLVRIYGELNMKADQERHQKALADLLRSGQEPRTQLPE